MRKRTGYLLRRGKVYYAVWTVSRKKFMRSTGKRDRREAEKELRRIMEPFFAQDEVATLQNIATRIEGRKAEIAKLEDERNPPLSLDKAWDAYLSAPGRPDSGERTLRDYAGYFDAFAAWIKEKHPDTVTLQSVSPQIADEYAKHLMAGRGLSNNSFNKHIRFMGLLFRVLNEPARLTGNPWEKIQRKRVIMESRRELTIDELKTVCAAATGEMRLLFAIGIYTGLRLGDCATLRWGEVDLRRGLIRRIPGKVARRNPRPVVIPVHPVLNAMLNDIPLAERGQYVLTETTELYLRDTSAMSKKIHDLFEACGVKTHRPGTGKTRTTDDKGKVEIASSGKRAIVEVGFHSLRHTFVSMCREANAPLSVVEAIVGHSNPAMTRHYTHTSELAAAAAVNSLPAIMGDTSALLPNSAEMDPDGKPANTRDTELRKIIEGMTAKTWKKDKARALAALAGKG